MNSSQRPDSFEPGDYLEVLRRRWWIVLVLAIVGLLAAAAYVKVAPKVYAGTAAVQVNATAANTGNVAGGRTSSGTINMDSEAQLVQSISVASLAGHTLHSQLTAAQLSKKISVAVPANSNVLQISCNASSPDVAAVCANAFASAFLQTQNSAAASQNAAQLKLLQGQVTSLGLSAARLSFKITSLPANSTERATDHVTLRSDNSQLSALSKQVGQLKGEANSSAGTIFGSAVPASTPTSPNALLLLPSGLMAGLLIGLIAAFLIDRRDKRIHGARDIERYLDLPV